MPKGGGEPEDCPEYIPERPESCLAWVEKLVVVETTPWPLGERGGGAGFRQDHPSILWKEAWE